MFCALYWLTKDFFEKPSDEVAEPQARGLSEIRNFLEHKYLRVTVVKAAHGLPLRIFGSGTIPTLLSGAPIKATS